MIRSNTNNRRTGTILPLLALALMGLMGMVALAIDIGLIAVARTQVQGAADIAALTGARLLNGDSTVTYNIGSSNTSAVSAATYNTILGQSVASSEVAIRTGQYTYDTTAQKFNPINYTTSPSAAPGAGTGAWTASEATISSSQPTYFARVLGVNTFSVGATATAVHRPRDVAILLDFSSSMKSASTDNWPSSAGDGARSLNPDPIWPQFGHWSRYVGLATDGTNPMQQTTNYTRSDSMINAPANYTCTTTSGPPLVGSTTATCFVTLSSGSYIPAFYNPQSSGYSATFAPCATPAPDDFATQSSATAPYVGDQAARIGLVAANSYAKTVQEVLNNGTTYSSNTHARDANWEQYGYDINNKANYTTSPVFKGYSMGPGYYGKTFWQWPPDPRYGTWKQNGSSGVYYYDTTTADPLNPSTTNPAMDTSGRFLADWRCRFFIYGSSNALAGKPVDDNNVLFDSSGNLRAPSSSGFAVNYPAILKWIKTGPQVFPPNLRSGRVLYYSAIPDVVTNTSNLDQVFWKSYIDYTLGISGGNTVYHGWENTDWGTGKITAKSSLVNAGKRMGNTATNVSVTGPVGTSPAPYMQYQDNPKQPRAHYWFGPYTLLMYICDDGPAGNMAPGTCTESQCWQLKAGVQSAIDDVKKNHPNDWLALIYFSGLSNFDVPRVKLGQDYTTMKNALWYPFSLLGTLSDTTQEIRPYDTSLNYTGTADIPNAASTTCPDMSLKLAYNEFSTASGYNGRKGASKMVIFETDGVANTSCGGTLSSAAPYLATYGTTAQIGTSTYTSNGDPTVLNAALATGQQICNLDNSSGKGYSTTRVPARIHAIAFGDLFQTSTTLETTAMTFLANMQIKGNTSPAGTTTIESYKIITGNYNTRIDNIKTAFERIMQSGVQVTLIR
jgi:Putative Flp pilus-assembly TadE/G-like